MHIIWLILKIIGILLAVLLGLLFAILMAVLFVPLRYRLEGWRRQENGEFAVKGRVSWFLSLISVRFGYEKQGFLQIRLLGIPWKGLKVRKKTDGREDVLPDDGPSSPVLLKATSIETAEKADKPKKLVQSEELPQPEKLAQSEKPIQLPKPMQSKESVRSEKLAQPEKLMQSAKLAQSEELPQSKEPPQPENLTQAETLLPPANSEPGTLQKIIGKIRNILRALWEKLKGVPNMARAFKERLAGIVKSLRQKKEKFDQWRAYLGSEEVRATLRLLWRQTKRLFRHLRPQKVRIRGRFGFGDPALTGQVTGLVSLLPVFYQKELSLQPEFSEACLEGEFFLKGRIRAASLLLLALKIWFNKDFQKVYKHLKAM